MRVIAKSCLFLGCLLLLPGLAVAEKAQQWELINPTGAIEQATVDPAKRITSLEGKTVLLRWNGKHNGDLVLDHLATLLAKRVPSAKIIKLYKDDPSTNSITGNVAESRRVSDIIKKLKPDLVIASQAD